MLIGTDPQWPWQMPWSTTVAAVIVLLPILACIVVSRRTQFVVITATPQLALLLFYMVPSLSRGLHTSGRRYFLRCFLRAQVSLISQELGETMSEEELREMIERADSNGDGEISVEDLSNLLIFSGHS